MIAFSSTNSGTVTSQSQYLSSSSGAPRPPPIFWASSYLESSPFFLLLLFTPTFLESLEPHFRLLVLCNLHIMSFATVCLQLCSLSSGFQISQSCFTPCAITSDHVPTCNFATQLFLSYSYLLFLRRFFGLTTAEIFNDPTRITSLLVVAGCLTLLPIQFISFLPDLPYVGITVLFSSYLAQHIPLN